MGLLLSGVVIGPHVLGVFPVHAPIADFLADLGSCCSCSSLGWRLISPYSGERVTVGHIRSIDHQHPVGSRRGSRALVWIPDGPRHRAGITAGIAYSAGADNRKRLGATELEPVTVTVGATVMSIRCR